MRFIPILQTISGFGPIVSALGDGGQYRHGRQVAAAVGLVPRQHCSGGKDPLSAYTV